MHSKLNKRKNNSNKLLSNEEPPKKSSSNAIRTNKEVKKADYLKKSQKNLKLNTEAMNKSNRYLKINNHNEKIRENNNIIISINNNFGKNISNSSLFKIQNTNKKDALKNNKWNDLYLKTSNKTSLYKNNKYKGLINYLDEFEINMEEYLRAELDDMDYDDAVKNDKRKFFEFLKARLKSKQIILNTFFVNEPLRPRAIKVLLIILDIDLYLFVNALFFNDDYISEIFHSTKEEKFFTFVTRSYNRFLYTTIVGVIVNYIIKFFFVEEKKLKGILKREKEDLVSLKYEISVISKSISRRYLCFIILSFILQLFLYIIFFAFIVHFLILEMNGLNPV